ncbi:MAG: hypothetical protein JXR60_07235 [Bacteroidales bacterium]|nr:hypothetical protein [Bacteroidales bacterium]
MQRNIELTAKEKQLDRLKKSQQDQKATTVVQSEEASTVAVHEANNSVETEAEAISDTKYQSSQLDAQQKDKLLVKLCKLVEEDKYYLKKDCNIESLSKKLSSNRKYVS